MEEVTGTARSSSLGPVQRQTTETIPQYPLQHQHHRPLWTEFRSASPRLFW